MAKRFTDTAKWEHAWFCELKPIQKLLWCYICDRCDAVGIWNVNFRLASFELGEEVCQADLETIGTGARLISISKDKVWLPGFIKFQYKSLNPKNLAHRGMMRTILQQVGMLPLSGESEELIENFKRLLLESQSTLGRGSIDPPGKGKGKGLGKGKEEEESEEKPEKPITPPYRFDLILNEYNFVDTSLVAHAAKFFSRFPSEREFRDWIEIALTSPKIEGKSRTQKLRYFGVSLKREIGILQEAPHAR